ncbi:aspartate beta-hydroxylase domain-containing protein 2 [Tachyglossus aculeatus]|uniref:aspartate beta-hydroxylase domain-containing protein 2 n=1 Tax=Tachyglossus aculeatus TaxID=9261 RepID=UPI0018F65B8E|nr:aspartate beta-hydroxylase domain-containing protein 2 [Tachyglossus aculeatus]
MPPEWPASWSWSLAGLRELTATGIQSVRDCDAAALATVACLLVLLLWYCHRVGRDRPSAPGAPSPSAAAPAPAALRPGVDPGGGGDDPPDVSAYCRSPGCGRCAAAGAGPDRRLYRHLQEYAKRYSWAGMGRVHKGVRAQGRYLAGRPAIQKPEVFLLPDLPSAPYFSREAQKHDVELLERGFPTVLAEFLRLAKAFSNCSLPQGWRLHGTPRGQWLTFPLVSRGVCVPRNCRRCPRTFRLLGTLRTCIGNNVFGNACISVLGPGTVVAEHYGPTNVRLRCHLGLKTPSGCELVVGGEPQCWAEGQCLLFDDSFLHTAFHEGPQEEGPRVVFMVDLWHPNVAAAERQALDFIFAPGR